MVEGEPVADGQLPVHFLPMSTDGRLGFSLLPGRRGRDGEGRFWTRDLEEDLDRLARVTGADVLLLVCSSEELKTCRVSNLVPAAQTRGLEVIERPLPSAHAPEDPEQVDRLLRRIQTEVSAGRTVVIASADGLNRAPMLAACFLVAQGSGPDRALGVVRKLRGPDCLPPGPHAGFVETFGLPRPLPGEPPTSGSAPPSMLEATPAKDKAGREAEAEAVVRTVGSKVAAALYERGSAGPSSEAEAPKGSNRTETAQGGGSEVPSRDFPSVSVGALKVGQSDCLETPQLAPEGSTVGASSLTPMESAVFGAALGAALGDALGYPLCKLDAGTMQARYHSEGPESPKLKPSPEGGPPRALLSQVTQHLECGLETMIEALTRRLELSATLDKLAERVALWAESPKGGPRDPEPSSLEAASKVAAGTPWVEAASNSVRGLSALARAPAFGMALFRHPKECERWGAAQCRITHRSPSTVAAASALAAGVAAGISGSDPGEVCALMVAAACKSDPMTAAKLARALHDADAGVPLQSAFDRWTETTATDVLAAALFVVRRAPEDFEGAIRQAVTLPARGHSAAATVGALLGARLGAGALPPAWLSVLERREQLEGLSLALAATTHR